MINSHTNINNEEFPIQRGLRQGDPMAPFLFIIAMEGLHVAVDNLVRDGKFQCANINNIYVSHLFYADDVMLVGDWSDNNVSTIIKALRFFHAISGLKINLEKSSIIGVGVQEQEVIRMASTFGCKPEKLPFNYLGIPIGGSSARVSMWDPIISKFKRRLSNWKANLLSIGGRTTLISSVLGSLGIYFLSLFRMPKKVNQCLEAIRSKFFWGGSKNQKKIAWVKWGSVLAAKEDGGLGIGSLEAMNHALLYRWRWRAISNPQSLWSRIIAAIHGNDCFINISAKCRGIWYKIAETAREMHKIPSITSGIISRKVGNGRNTKFWKDNWCGDSSLAKRFPRLFALELDKECMVSDRRNASSWSWNWRRPLLSSRDGQMLNDLHDYLPRISTSEENDKWVWNFNGKSYFSIAQLRLCIDHFRLPINNNMKTRWNTLIPKKVNIFAWRLRRDCLPNLINLFAKGVDVTTVTCVLCSKEAEFPSHTFQHCNVARETRNLLSKWLNKLIPSDLPDGVLDWCESLNHSMAIKKRLEAILFVWWWHIWRARNNKLHNDTNEESIDIFNSIVSTSYLWIVNRDRKSLSSWDDWNEKPLVM